MTLHAPTPPPHRCSSRAPYSSLRRLLQEHMESVFFPDLHVYSPSMDAWFAPARGLMKPHAA